MTCLFCKRQIPPGGRFATLSLEDRPGIVYACGYCADEQIIKHEADVKKQNEGLAWARGVLGKLMRGNGIV